MTRNNEKMSREEAGRKGGEATANNHDQEFYQEIGQKGGEATAENHDKEFYQEIGQKGGSSGGNGRSRSSDDNGDSDGKMSREEAGRKGGQKSRR